MKLLLLDAAELSQTGLYLYFEQADLAPRRVRVRCRKAHLIACFWDGRESAVKDLRGVFARLEDE